MARLLARMGGYSYSGQAGVLYRQVRSAGTSYHQCLIEVAPTDVTCPAGQPR